MAIQSGVRRLQATGTRVIAPSQHIAQIHYFHRFYKAGFDLDQAISAQGGPVSSCR
jgi:hypothetical protein